MYNYAWNSRENERVKQELLDVLCDMFGQEKAEPLFEKLEQFVDRKIEVESNSLKERMDDKD